MKFSIFQKFPHLAALIVLTSTRAEKLVWSEGHGDLAVNYVNGAWQWNAEEEKAVDSVIIRLNDVARNEIPANAAFSFLGTTGDPIWIIPAAQTPGIPFLGINAGRTPAGTFLNDRFDLSLASVNAPGAFIVWTTSGTGSADILFNSRDGITASDKANVPAGGHFHENWGFTSPGTYRIGFKASGVLSGQSVATNSDETVYTFEINVIKSGEADIEVAYEDDHLEFHAHDELTDREYDPAHVALQASPGSWQSVPPAAAFSFLGKPGEIIYVLPQSEREGVLSLGVAAAEVASGVFANDRVSIELLSVVGPGNVHYYEIDQFGAPTVLFDSADGISASDAVDVVAGSPAHRNLSFSAPGIYRVTLQASGTLAAGGEITSAPATFLFEVMPPEFVEEGEIDFEVAFEDGKLELGFHDHGADRELDAQDVVLVLRPAAQRPVPNDPAFNFLGAPGSSFYVVPQDETEGLLFLGTAAEEIESGLFTGETIQLELIAATGPGSFSLYSVDTFGKPTVFMNSADGTASADLLSIAVGSHRHLNWAFTRAGEYQLTLKATGTLLAGTEAIASDPAILRFLVQERTAGPILNASLTTNPRQLQISWESRNDASYQFQSRSSLGDGEWANQGAVIPGLAGIQTISIDITTGNLRLFRLVEL
jgi:surface-anchored protein